MTYLPAVVFICACFVFAFNSHYSITGRTNTLAWHLTQWGAILLFIISAFLFGLWARDFSYYWFGEIIGAAVIGVPVYVKTLHWLNKNPL